MINYVYHFGHRYRSGNFDLYVEKADTKTNEVLDRHLIFRTWEKPDIPVPDDAEFYWDDDEIERQGYNSYKFTMKNKRNDSLILRHIIKLPFTQGKDWLKTGKKT